MKPRLSVIMVTYRRPELALRAIGSIIEHTTTPHEIIVVDNASGDGTPSLIEQAYPEVRLIRNESNRGFAAANNQGLGAARGRFLMLLNPDTELREESLDQLVEHLEWHAGCSVVGPRLVYPDGTLQLSCGSFPTPTLLFIENFGLRARFPRHRWFGRYMLTDWDHAETRSVDWITGAALMARREEFERIGGLDESFFMYCEELDWCRRVHDAGGDVQYLPHATIVHHEGGSSSASDERAVFRSLLYGRFVGSQILYFHKHHGAAGGATARVILFVAHLLRLLRWVRGSDEPRKARRAAFRTAMRACLTSTAQLRNRPEPAAALVEGAFAEEEDPAGGAAP